MTEDFKLIIQNLLISYEKQGLSSTKFKKRYQVLLALKDTLFSVDNDSDLYNCLLKIVNIREENIRTYAIKVNEYNNLLKNKADISILNKLAFEINDLVNESEVYKTLIDIYNEAYTKKEANKVSLNSEEIIKMLKDYSNSNGSAKEILNKKIFEIREKREKDIKDKYGIDGVKILFEVESLENRIALLKDDNKEFSVNLNEYEKVLKETILMINEYNFRDDDSIFYKPNLSLMTEDNERLFYRIYNSSIIRFHNMINALFNRNSIDLIDFNNNVFTSDDLIHLLSNYNINGGYRLFMSKYGKARIGNEIVSKKIYDDNIEFIKKCIQVLYDKVRENFKSDKVLVSSSNKLEKDLLKEINDKSVLLSNLKSKEDPSVHR